jgi:hypothetical protein
VGHVLKGGGGAGLKELSGMFKGTFINCGLNTPLLGNDREISYYATFIAR